MLADATAAALLAVGALPPVLADASAAALLAHVAPPPVLADAAAAALLAVGALPPVLADASAAALLAHVAPPPVLADASAAALPAHGALPPVLADATAHHSIVLSDDATAALLAQPAQASVLAVRCGRCIVLNRHRYCNRHQHRHNSGCTVDGAAAALLACGAHSSVLANDMRARLQRQRGCAARLVRRVHQWGRTPLLFEHLPLSCTQLNGVLSRLTVGRSTWEHAPSGVCVSQATVCHLLIRSDSVANASSRRTDSSIAGPFRAPRAARDAAHTPGVSRESMILDPSV